MNIEISKYKDDASFLAGNTTLWIIPYVKDYLRGEISEEKYREIITKIFKNNYFGKTVNIIIKDILNYSNILNVETVILDNILKKINESKGVGVFDLDNEFLSKDEITFVLNMLFKMYAELFYKLDIIIKEIKKEK